MKKVLYTAALLTTLALLQLNVSAKGGLSGSDIKNPQQLQVTQGFAGDAMFAGDGGVGQNVGQTATNTASSSSSLGFSANFGGGAVGNGIAGLGNMFGGNKAAAPANAPAAKPAARPAASNSTALIPFNDLD